MDTGRRPEEFEHGGCTTTRLLQMLLLLNVTHLLLRATELP